MQKVPFPYPSEYGTTDIGRATKGAAKILAGKVYLTKGDYSKAKEKLQRLLNKKVLMGMVYMWSMEIIELDTESR